MRTLHWSEEGGEEEEEVQLVYCALPELSYRQ